VKKRFPVEKKGFEKLESVKIYTDGAARGNPGEAGAGVVMLNGKEEVIQELSRYLGVTTNNVAEYQGAIMGFTTALELKARNVELYSDSELLVRQLLGIYKVKSPGLVPLHCRVLELMGKFSKVKITHIPREQNWRADRLANLGIDERAQSRTDGRSSSTARVVGEGRKVRAPKSKVLRNAESR